MKLLDQLSDYQFLTVYHPICLRLGCQKKILRNSAKTIISRTAAVQQDACIFVSQ